MNTHKSSVEISSAFLAGILVAGDQVCTIEADLQVSSIFLGLLQQLYSQSKIGTLVQLNILSHLNFFEGWGVVQLPTKNHFATLGDFAIPDQ